MSMIVVKEKMTSSLKVSGVIVNARAITILAVSFCFLWNLSQWSKTTAFRSIGFIKIYCLLCALKMLSEKAFSSLKRTKTYLRSTKN